MRRLFKKLLANLPLLLVIGIAVFITLQNTSSVGFYSGWDNIHAEFNLKQYAYRVLFGAWEEHGGLGGPSAKGHLAEITRIPILYLLNSIFPTYLVRAMFLFLMYIIGGVSMYYLVKNWWTTQFSETIQSYIAGFAALLYLLHPLTLQQFYISFELFTVQFAFFPVVLLAINSLSKSFSKRTAFVFLLAQLCIASSGHTPTVFYLGVLASLVYAFAINLEHHKKIVSALKFSLIIGLSSFLMNAFWIIPNLYYSLHNSQYVTESKANIVFGPEALWSIRESSTLDNFLSGYHYLTSWKDYNFAKQEHELIFNEWTETFANPFTKFQLYALASLTILGGILVLILRKKYPSEISIVLLYVTTSVFIWIDLFPTKNLILKLYQNKTFLEIFRNPFTKLSILHSVFVVLLAAKALHILFTLIEKKVSQEFAHTVTKILLCVGFVYVLSITTLSFYGHFINEKLRVVFPPVYEELFAFMQTKNHSARVLEMPYVTREGWVLYDWTAQKGTNGYQGLGFYFFGIPQPFLTPDFARWSGVNDYFYEELSFALNSKNDISLQNLVEKYHVPYAILDESRVVPYQEHSFDEDKRILEAAGFVPIWNREFVTVYEQPELLNQEQEFIIPSSITNISANLERTSDDPAYERYAEYMTSDSQLDKTTVVFPFTQVLKSELETYNVKEGSAYITEVIPNQSFEAIIPAFAKESYKTTGAIIKEKNQIKVFFPQFTLKTDTKTMDIDTIPNAIIETGETEVVAISVNNTLYPINEGKYTYFETEIKKGANIAISDQDGEILTTIQPSWEELETQRKFLINNSKQLSFIVSFPIIQADLTRQPSENCVKPQRGTIKTTFDSDGSAIYEANEFGVNCNSVSLPFMSPTNSYIATVNGENNAGRSIKLFVHYSEENSVFTEYIFPENFYKKNYPLRAFSSNEKSKMFFNWETRSFGKYSKNTLHSLEFMPAPLDLISQIELQPIDQKETLTIQNNARILEKTKHNNAHYSLQIECIENCFFGINQAFDDGWIAYNISSKKFLNHFRYNNWANLWEIEEGKHTIKIVYVPQLIAFIAMGIALITSIVYLLIKKKVNVTQKIEKKRHQIKKQIKYMFIRSKNKK